MLKYVDNEDFEKEVLKSEKAVLVDFFATWCGPCQTLGEVLKKVSNEREDFDIVKVDIDKNQDLAYKYNIEVVPTMIIFKNGQALDQKEGFCNKDEIEEMMKNYL